MFKGQIYITSVEQYLCNEPFQKYLEQSSTETTCILVTDELGLSPFIGGTGNIHAETSGLSLASIPDPVILPGPFISQQMINPNTRIYFPK